MALKEKIVFVIQLEPLLAEVIGEAEDFGYRNEPIEITEQMIKLNDKLIQLKDMFDFFKPLRDLWDNEEDEIWNDA